MLGAYTNEWTASQAQGEVEAGSDAGVEAGSEDGGRGVDVSLRTALASALLIILALTLLQLAAATRGRFGGSSATAVPVLLGYTCALVGGSANLAQATATADVAPQWLAVVLRTAVLGLCNGCWLLCAGLLWSERWNGDDKFTLATIARLPAWAAAFIYAVAVGGSIALSWRVPFSGLGLLVAAPAGIAFALVAGAIGCRRTGASLPPCGAAALVLSVLCGGAGGVAFYREAALRNQAMLPHGLAPATVAELFAIAAAVLAWAGLAQWLPAVATGSREAVEERHRKQTPSSDLTTGLLHPDNTSGFYDGLEQSGGSSSAKPPQPAVQTLGPPTKTDGSSGRIYRDSFPEFGRPQTDHGTAGAGRPVAEAVAERESLDEEQGLAPTPARITSCGGGQNGPGGMPNELGSYESGSELSATEEEEEEAEWKQLRREVSTGGLIAARRRKSNPEMQPHRWGAGRRRGSGGNLAAAAMALRRSYVRRILAALVRQLSFIMNCMQTKHWFVLSYPLSATD